MITPKPPKVTGQGVQAVDLLHEDVLEWEQEDEYNIMESYREEGGAYENILDDYD